MNRTPPPNVQRVLREEVGFGCPIAHCRKPFLTWHHFDPPWREKNHHEPEGMIALCTEHHPGADARKWTKAQLHELKKSASSLVPVQARFDWMMGHHLIRLGGNYVGMARAPVRAAGEEVIVITENPNAGLELSLVLRDQEGRAVIQMRENMFQADPEHLRDLQVTIGGTRIKVKAKRSDVVLDLWAKRLTLDQLLEQLRMDAKRAEQDYSRINPWYVEFMPRIDLVDSRVTHDIMEWSQTHCLDDEGRIPVLDFHNMLIYAGGSKIEFNRGIWSGGRILFSFAHGAAIAFDF